MLSLRAETDVIWHRKSNGEGKSSSSLSPSLSDPSGLIVNVEWRAFFHSTLPSPIAWLLSNAVLHLSLVLRSSRNSRDNFPSHWSEAINQLQRDVIGKRFEWLKPKETEY